MSLDGVQGVGGSNPLVPTSFNKEKSGLHASKTCSFLRFSRSAEWTSQQVVEAFPWDSAPEYLLRDRDSIYGAFFRQRVANMGIREVITARQSPWQNPFVERLIGSIRRECLDHVITLNETHHERLLSS